jgi:lipopolysaccharide/colanic/teichoic acid biosynthesis glycosyltransferase
MSNLRLMAADAEPQLPNLLDRSNGNRALFKLKTDRQVSKIGTFLHRYILEALPQLINALRSDISLGGRRLPLASEVGKDHGWARRCLLENPGTIGLGQVVGRSELSREDCIRLGLSCAENWSLTEDVTILYHTMRVVIRPNDAH